MNPASVAQARARGFTLIELLTVVAIIGILIAILIPAVNAVRVSVAANHSIANLRQLSVAMTVFADDNKGRLPLTEDSSTNNPYGSWDMGLLPYLNVERNGLTVAQSAENLFFHPRDPAPARTDGKARRTYAMNAATGGPGGIRTNNALNANSMLLSQITNPSRVIILAERPNSSNSTVCGTSWADIVSPSQITLYMTGEPELNPGGKYNFGFVDGHVESLALASTYGSGSLTSPQGLWVVGGN